jgi:hypothetical protein
VLHPDISQPKCQGNVDVALALEVAGFGHAQAFYVRGKRMGITARDEGNADFELPGQIFLRLVKPSQEASATEIASHAHRTVDITIQGTERPGRKDETVIGFEHLRDDRRPGFKFVSKRANKSYNLISNDGDDRAQIFRDLSRLLERKSSR